MLSFIHSCALCFVRVSINYYYYYYPRGDRPPRRRRRPVLPPGGGLASDPARVSGAGGRARQSGVRPDRGRDTPRYAPRYRYTVIQQR